jgi:hypothetical protein
MALKLSNVALGTAFEHLSINYLTQAYKNMILTRQGQAGDGGIDFKGQTV